MRTLAFACRKSPVAPAFSDKTRFPCAFDAAGETCTETLLRKASESTAHVAGFGIQLGGLRPADDASEEVIRGRLDVYRQQTAVVSDYYAAQGKF